MGKSKTKRIVSGVYFIRCGPLLKIGHAANVRKRFTELKSLTYGSDAEVIGVIRCLGFSWFRRIDLERQMLRKFRAFHIVGEWFALTAESVALARLLSKPFDVRKQWDITHRLPERKMANEIESRCFALHGKKVAEYLRDRALQS